MTVQCLMADPVALFTVSGRAGGHSCVHPERPGPRGEPRDLHHQRGRVQRGQVGQNKICGRNFVIDSPIMDLVLSLYTTLNTGFNRFSFSERQGRWRWCGRWTGRRLPWSRSWSPSLMTSPPTLWRCPGLSGVSRGQYSTLYSTLYSTVVVQ